MGLFSYVIGAGTAGLAGQRAMQRAASANITNVNTPGYVRQRMILGSQLGRVGVGVQRAQGPRNRLLMDHIGQVNGQLGFHVGNSNSLAMVEHATNEIEGIGLGPRMTEFEEAIRGLEADPGNIGLRKEVLNAGRKLSYAFKNTRKQFIDSAKTIQYEMKATANEVNRMAKEIAGLNEAIMNSQGVQGDVQNLDMEELFSRRDHLISRVSEMVGVTNVHKPDGTSSLYVAGGRLLVDGPNSTEIKVGQMGPGPNYALDIKITSIDGPLLDPVKEFGGLLGGMKEGFDTSLRSGVNRIDEIAFSYINEFNARHQGGFGLNGSTGLDFFQNPGATADGAAGAMQLDAAVEASPEQIAAAVAIGNLPGGNGNLTSLAETLTDAGILADGSAVLEAWTNFKFDITNRIQTASMGVETERASAIQLENLFQAEAGVSLDEEMIAMSQAKTAFDASSQVIRAADEMAQTVLMMVR